MEKGRIQSQDFWFNFDPLFPLEMAEIEINKQQCRKTSAKYVKIKALSPLPFPGKMIIICNIWAIFARKQGGITSQRVRIKIWQILFHPHYSWSTSYKKNFDSDNFQFCGYRSQRTFQKSFNPNSQVWLLFLVPHLHF